MYQDQWVGAGKRNSKSGEGEEDTKREHQALPPLLSIPQELRDLIYEILLVNGGVVGPKVHNTRTYSFGGNETPRSFKAARP